MYMPANLAELLAQALALESEAAARYEELAEIMAAHNNHRVADLFLRMAALESRHAEAIRAWALERGAQVAPGGGYRWRSPEGPETTDPCDLHYLMTPRHALALALHNERRAVRFFTAVAEQAPDQATGALAEELLREEREHVAWVQQWLAQYPAVPGDWDADDDPPLVQD